MTEESSSEVSSRTPGPGQTQLPLPAGTELHFSEQYSGPIPPSGELARLEELVPGISARWFGLVEGDVQAEVYRKRTEAETAKALADASIERHKLGQAIAFLIAIVCIAAAIVFFALANPVAGGFFLSVPVIQLIQTFWPKQ